MAHLKKTILLVEDDLRLSRLVKDYLERQEYEILIEHDGSFAVERILTSNPDLVILDLMLPGKDGLSICRDVRTKYDGQILILTAREDDMDQVAGLELGADDYVKKPVEPRVLLARIRTLFRRMERINTDGRSDTNAPSRFIFGNLQITKTSREVQFDGQVLDLSTMEFDLLWQLSSNHGQVLDRDCLYQAVKGIEYDGLDRSLDVAVSRLRKKLNDNPDHPYKIKTVWGSGYLFVADAWEKKGNP